MSCGMPNVVATPRGIRCSARRWASADFGVRFSYVAISFCSASCMGLLRTSGRSIPCSQYVSKAILACVAKARPIASRAPQTASDCLLENQLQRELNLSRVSCTLDAAKVRAIGRIAIGREKLRMVPGVKELRAEFGAQPLRDGRGFQNRQIGLTDGRSATNRPRGVSDGSQSLRRKAVGVEARVNRDAWHRARRGCVRSRIGAGAERACITVPRVQLAKRKDEIGLACS